MNQTWENSKKPSFGPDFDPNLVPQNVFPYFTSKNAIYCSKLSLYAISKKIYEPNLIK